MRSMVVTTRSWAEAARNLGRVLLGTLLVFWVFPAAAQTVRPVVVEYTEKAQGRFELVNNSDFPVHVILEAKSFGISLEGKPLFRPLDDHIHLKLSSMSFRIPPGQGHYVFYKATADVLPAWFVIYSTFRGLRTREGMNVAVELPHTVYLVQKEPLKKADLRLTRVEYLAESRQVIAELENPSDRMGRAMQVRLSSNAGKQGFGGFPLLPENRRRLVLDWDREEGPKKLAIRFKKFTLEKEVRVPKW